MFLCKIRYPNNNYKNGFIPRVGNDFQLFIKNENIKRAKCLKVP